MAEELLGYYHRELTYIRRLAAKFAEAHPKIAERLRLSTDDASDDPHVERLIEAFAYLTARVRHKLDDEFPEITSSLLDVLYPHYQAPIPSMAIVQLMLDPEQAQLTSSYPVPRHTELETEPIHGEPCRFRTCYSVTLWPIELKQAVLAQAPLPAPATAYSADATSVLRLVLTCPSKETTFGSLEIDRLRFFLKGQPQHVHRLYELIFNHTIGVALAGSMSDAQPIELGCDCLRQVGFERDEGMLPYPPRSFLGYRLLTEYFAFPQKYLFVDLEFPGPATLSRLGNQLEIYLFLNRAVPELARSISAETFQLGCTPIVNLYEHRAEPIQLTHTDFEYQVVPDRRLPHAHEVYSVDRVVASPPKGASVEFLPFFSIKHSLNRGVDKTFWHATRRPAEGTGSGVDRGTEVFLSLVDLGFRPSSPADWTVEVATTCLNRDLPQDLPFGGRGDQPRLQLREGGGLISRIVCLTAPTRTLRPALQHGLLWRLVSHLSLNHLSLVDDGKAEALREVLKLYDFADSSDTRNQIDSILGVSSRRVVGSMRTGGPVAFCRGTEITLQFDEDRFTVSGLFLFASVLERFLALYCTVNSFSKLIATVKGREGELRRWQPRMGEKVLV
jgi:type VI secretion system protein ImpG